MNNKQTGIVVELIGQDGNAFAIMGAVTKAMKRVGVSANIVAAYQKEATAGDYDNLLRVTAEYVEIT